MTTRDNLRVEQVYFENLKRTMNELAAKKSELDGAMQTLAENAVAADENIIMLYKNLCEAWIEAENLFKKVDIDTQAITERIDSLQKEFNEKIDEVNNYIVSITRALDERLTQAEEDIDALEGRMTTAEGDIDALEGRMDTAEGDIDALEGRMDTAEGDIDALEGRMDTAEDDIDSLETRMTAAETAIDNLESGSLVYDTVTNQAIASVTDGQYNGEVVSLIAAIEPVQSGSGDPSPTNIRPITGWTGLIVTRTGKNFADLPTVTIASMSYVYDHAIDLKPGTYTFSATYDGSNAGSQSSLRIDDENGNQIFSGSITIATGRNTKTFTITENAKRIKWYSEAAGTYSDGMIEQGSTATSYEAYAGNTYPVSWQTEAGTVYKGTLDITNGVLSVNWGRIELNSINWTYIENGTYFASNIQLKIKGNFNIKCDSYKTSESTSVSNMGNLEIKGNADNNGVYIKNSNYTDATGFKNSLIGVYAIYQLATPTTYQLTPTEVRLLLGTNNLWADTGNILEMEYPCDLKLYIDKKISQITPPTNLSTTRTEHDFSAAQEVFDALKKTEITDAEEPEEER